MTFELQVLLMPGCNKWRVLFAAVCGLAERPRRGVKVYKNSATGSAI